MGYEASPNRNVTNQYGVRSTDEKFGSNVSTKGLEKQLVVEFDYNDLPSASFPKLGVQIPAKAVITSSKLEIITAFTSTSTTTDLTVGVADADGGSTVTDPEALITAAQATQTTIAVANSIIDGASGTPAAAINVSYAEAVVVTVAGSASDLLTGRARLVVEYIENKPASYVAPTGT